MTAFPRYRENRGPYADQSLKARVRRVSEGWMPQRLFLAQWRLRLAWMFRECLRDVPKAAPPLPRWWITRRDIERGQELARERGWA